MHHRSDEKNENLKVGGKNQVMTATVGEEVGCVKQLGGQGHQGGVECSRALGIMTATRFNSCETERVSER